MLSFLSTLNWLRAATGGRKSAAEPSPGTNLGGQQILAAAAEAEAEAAEAEAPTRTE